ncbi:MAG: glycosyltransferase family protein [Bryobacteraceae bacterium]
MTDWHHRLQRSQQLARHLAALGRRCFLLNPHLGREYAAAPWRTRRPALAQLEERVFEIHAPLCREPVFHHRLLTPAESRAVFEASDWALRRASASQADILFALPTWTAAAQWLRQHWRGVLAYDCHDWLAGFSNMAPAIANAEPEAMRAADVVIFSAAGLQQHFCARLPDIQPRAALVRNGAPDWPEPTSGRTREPVAGYLGALEDWFWTEAVEAAARALPDVRFVLAGKPSEPVRRTLSSFANVVLAGEIPHREAPALLERFRIGLIPFRGELAPFTDPLKIYEYFHFGLPVAAGRMRELDRFGRLVYQAATPDEFARAVATALQEEEPELEAARRREARASTWKRRAEQLHAVLMEARAGSDARLS